jgi:hypothetical protein
MLAGMVHASRCCYDTTETRNGVGTAVRQRTDEAKTPNSLSAVWCPSSFQRTTALSFMLTIEALLEDAQHLASYEVAVQAVGMQNSSFSDWKALFSSTDDQREDNNMIYILLNEVHQSANI